MMPLDLSVATRSRAKLLQARRYLTAGKEFKEWTHGANNAWVATPRLIVAASLEEAWAWLAADAPSADNGEAYVDLVHAARAAGYASIAEAQSMVDNAGALALIDAALAELDRRAARAAAAKAEEADRVIDA